MVLDRVFIEKREHYIVNNDPQNRVYNGCMFNPEERVGAWEYFHETTEETAEDKLVFWQELSAYAVEARGKGATTDYRIRREATNEAI